MKKYLHYVVLSIIIQLSVGDCKAQPTLVVGQTQDMMFTDIAPDISYSCNWPNGMRTCWKLFPFDVNHDGITDFNLSHSYVECMFSSYRSWSLRQVGNVEFLADSLGITPFHTGDTIETTSVNYKPDISIDYLGSDSVGNPIYDTIHFVRAAQWIDTTSIKSRKIAYVGGGNCPGTYNWNPDYHSDTNYFVFRLIQSADTMYGWAKLRFNGINTIIGESFAITGDTGNYVYSAIENIANTTEIKLYPNPATTSVTISIDEALLNSSATITDITGRKMTAVQLVTCHSSLVTSDFSNGVYFVTVTDKERRSTTKKLIIE